MSESRTIHSADGTALNMLRWGKSGPDVLIVHGQGEHAQRYDELGVLLVRWGYRATAVELRGHGYSTGARNHIKSWGEYIEDVQAAVKQLTPPYVILGHSMGGLVVLDFLRQNLEPKPLGVVLSNPLVALAFDPPAVKVAVANLLSKALPELALSTELDTTLLSRDKEVVRRYNEDPLINRKVTTRWYTEMTACLARVQDGKQYPYPLLMLVGTSDGITSPPASVRLYESWAGSPKELHEYQGWYHETFNEPDRAQAHEHLKAWLAVRFATVPTPS